MLIVLSVLGPRYRASRRKLHAWPHRIQATCGAVNQIDATARQFKGLEGGTINLPGRDAAKNHRQVDSWYTATMDAEVQERTGGRRLSARERLLDLAEAGILQKGFAATSIDELIAGAGITKSGFFYHFKDKNNLAKALLVRHFQRDEQILDDLFRRADALNEDPLHGFLVGLKLLADMLADLPGRHPGCLVASFCYQDQLFDAEVRKLNAAGTLAWRKRFRAHLDRIAARYRPRTEVDLDALADMASALVEGGIILSKLYKDAAALPKQVLLYRSFIRMVFAPETA